MIAPALDMMRTAGLILLRRGWLMALIYAAGAAAQFGLLQVVGRIGAYDAVAGMLLLPLPILARLTALVGMLLVVRGELEYLGRLAPLPTDPRERRAAMGRALLGGIVPFMAFYLTWGYLAGDVADYTNIALLERERVEFAALADHLASGSTEAIVLAWRAGPVLIATYAFLNTLTAPLEPFLSRFAIGLVGPHDESFWREWAPLLSVVPAMIVQTVLITLAAAAYDSALEARALRDAAAERELSEVR